MLNNIFPLISQDANHTVLVTVVITPFAASATWIDGAVALLTMDY